MRTDAITEDQLAVLSALKSSPEVADFYLARGTALALRYAHRRSVDFDFFREDPFDEKLP